MVAGHIKVLGRPHVARGPDVAQACIKAKLPHPIYACIHHRALRFGRALDELAYWEVDGT